MNISKIIAVFILLVVIGWIGSGQITNVKAQVGSNNGNKLSVGEKIFLKKNNINNIKNKKINIDYSNTDEIRILKGTNFDSFSNELKDKFLEQEFSVTNMTDRMGMRLKGIDLENAKQSNIKSEGMVRGVIQIPPDGNPIILLSDHGTIGGYPKIAVVASCDYDKLVQKIPNTKIKFKCIDLIEAENLYKDYIKENKEILKNIK